MMIYKEGKERHQLDSRMAKVNKNLESLKSQMK